MLSKTIVFTAPKTAELKQTRIIRTCLKGHNFGAFRFVVAYKRQLYKFLRAKNPSKFCTF